MDVQGGAPIYNGENIEVYTDNNGPAQRWAFFANGDGSCRLMPKVGNQAMCISVNGGSMENSANLHLWDYTGASEQGWILERASNSTNNIIPNDYSVTNNAAIRCYAFGMYLSVNNLNVKDYEPGDSIEVTKNKVIAHFPNSTKLYNRSVRVVGKNDYINPNKEFKMALKTYTTTFLGIVTGGDYHFMLQCKNGTWANKLSWADSENLGYIDPSAGDWNYGGIDPNTGNRIYGEHAYTDGPVYFAVAVH